MIYAISSEHLTQIIILFIAFTSHFAIIVVTDSSQANSQSSVVVFKCPEQFGYYADNNNCSKYFVCVFGEALHESCTGGLRFSSELQTCDWPRNVVCLLEDSDTESQKNSENVNKGLGLESIEDDRNNDQLYDYNTEDIRQQLSNDKQNDDNLRNVQNSFEDLLQHKNQNNRNIIINHNTNEDFLDLQRSRSVVSPQERNFGQQLIGRSVSGVRVTSMTSSTSDSAYKDMPAPNNSPKQSEPQKNNRVTVEDLQNPNFDEAIAAIVDENGGVHLNDGPGSLFALIAQDHNPGEEDSVFVKPMNSELKQNTRRGLTQNQIVLINRTQLSLPIRPANNNRGPPSRLQPVQRHPNQYIAIQHQVLTNPLNTPLNTSYNRYSVSAKPTESQPIAHAIPQPISQPQPQQRSNSRTPRQRIHIIVNNRTQVQEIPIDDQIDFQRIPAIQQPSNRYQNRRPLPVLSAPTVRTTTPVPRRETTERQQQWTQNQENSYVGTNERRQPSQNARALTPTQPEYIKKDTFPQRPAPVYRTPEPFSTAVACNQRSCRLPDCLCAGTDIPGGLPLSQVPQIVLITFDDAINDINWNIYDDIFKPHRTNPNGCPIRATFYVSHEWTDYGQVQTLYSRGHEMASHSVTHSFGERFSKNQWNREIGGQREILHLYGGVNLEDIRGMRAPFLQGGGNKQFEMLFESNFTYDSTMPIFENSPPFWPFTLDYASNHECMIAPCPTKSFPGFWEIGMVMWQDLRGGRCSMGDACSNPTDENGVYDMIMKNFNRHYLSNRAPFGLYFHSAWFNSDHHKRGFIRVIDQLLSQKDVYFMTKWQSIQWIRNPKPVHEMHRSQAWQCPQTNTRPPPCPQPNICNLNSRSGSRFMKTCQPCPHTYPWVGNTGFAKS